MRKTNAKSETTASLRVTFAATLCVDNVSLLRNGHANQPQAQQQSLASLAEALDCELILVRAERTKKTN